MRRLFVQFATVLALVIAPVVAFASPLVGPAWLSENLDDARLVILVFIKSTKAVMKHS